MCIHYQLDEQRGLLLVQMMDTITNADIITCVKDSWQIPHRIRFAELIDMRDITRFEVTSSGLREAVSVINRLNTTHAPLTTAIVATTDLTYGMARIYEVYNDANSMTVRVFRAYESALEWIRRVHRPAPADQE